MTKLPRSSAILFAAMVLLIAAVPAFAGDPPSRVMRLKYISGQVSFQPGGVDDWVAATVNRPLTTADRVWTDKDSRAELHLGTAALRMDGETSLTVTNLNDSTVQVELDQGVLNVHVRKMYGGEIYEVDTPNVAFTLLKSGDYRFEVDPNGDVTSVIVRKGRGEGNGNGRGVEVESGEMARFEHGNTLMHTMAQAPRLDGFDDWCRVRDQREDKYDSLRYVSDEVNGYEDLDEYGYWHSVPTYGYVWVPRTVVVGWAPYRYGHWAWIEPWGWTWVDDAPWGFAPFHYGRWVYSSYGWSWCPGPRHYRPVYAPALVAWFGGSHWGVGVSFGGGYGVGWVPLGWGEPYYPYYRVSRGYVRNVNISNTHITNITNVTNNYYTVINNRNSNNVTNVRYMNQNVRGGATVVSSDVLQHGRPIPKSMVAVNDRDMASARFMHGAEVAPARAGVLGGRENLPAALPPSSAMNRHVVTKMTPPERPEKFEERRPFIERNNGMAVDRETMANMRRENPSLGSPKKDGEVAQPGNADRGRGLGNEPGRAVNGDQPNAGRPGNANAGRPVNTDRPAANADRSNGGDRPANAEARSVPRPPDRGPRVINLDRAEKSGDGEIARPNNQGQGNDARATKHYVPRPPAERRPASGNDAAPAMNAARENGRERGADSIQHQVPKPPDSVKAAAPEERRSPVFDRTPEQRKAVEAEVTTPRNVPRPPEGVQVRRPDAENSNVMRRSAPDASERRSAPDVSERRSAPQPSVERRSAPEPSMERRSAPERSAPESRPAPAQRSEPQRQEHRSAPPADKPAKADKVSMNYNEGPRFSESRSSFAPSREVSYYSPRSSSPRSYTSSYADRSYARSSYSGGASRSYASSGRSYSSHAASGSSRSSVSHSSGGSHSARAH